MAPKAAPAKAEHPPYATMIAEAIKALGDRTGSSSIAIAKFIGDKHKMPENFKKTLAVQLKRQVEGGKLVKVKASFKLSDEGKAALKKALAPKKPVVKKPVAKKPAAKKPAAKKTTTIKKPTVKKTTAVKKATTPKKPAVKKASTPKKASVPKGKTSTGVKKTSAKKPVAKKPAAKKTAPKK